MYRIAFLSMHGCPVSRLGEKDTGGMNVYVLQAAKELGRRGNRVDVFTRWHDPNDPQIVHLGSNARVIHLEAGPYDKAKEGLYRLVPEFTRELHEFRRAEEARYDVVHSHYWLSGLVGEELRREWGVPHVTTFHTLARTKLSARVGEKEPRFRERAESRVMKRADAIVVSTEQEKQDLSRLYESPPGRVEVIPAGVDLDLFQPIDRAEARRKLGLTEKKIVLSVGRMQPLKGLDVLIGAMSRLGDTSDTRLVLVGGDPERDRELTRLQTFARGLRLQDRVSFVGAVKQVDLPAYYSAADVFVLPSYYESFGLVALEAMACGLPIIASRVGGPRTFVKQGVIGYLIPWHCPEPYAERLEVLLSNTALRESMGRAAREKARGMGWNRVAGNLLGLYTTVVRPDLRSVAGA